ncbi:MAG: citrate lyase acyl carrier protein [Angelakisella sp.]|jgi:citrate lyase subunit gamma (acyl carrier protein)|nr:citrate lyase acyl carrier protein [Angelakisella sp.]MCI9528385.1 citrate lyase acyl carrier protein [Angelakisella sp.]
MEIVAAAMAGTLESSDAQVTVEPADGLEIRLSSSVMSQYGRQIRQVVADTLARLEVTGAKVTVIDKGALDCTLKARVEAAALRGAGRQGDAVPWGGAVR